MKNKITDKIEMYVSERQKIINRENSKKIFAENILRNWETINPYKVSDTQNRINILTKKTPKNNYFLYELPYELYELEKKVNGARSKILRELKEVNPRDNEYFLKADKYSTKFYERGMTSEDLKYLKKSSVEEIVEDLKKGKIGSGLKNLEGGWNEK